MYFRSAKNKATTQPAAPVKNKQAEQIRTSAVPQQTPNGLKMIRVDQ